MTFTHIDQHVYVWWSPHLVIPTRTQVQARKCHVSKQSPPYSQHGMSANYI